MKEYPIARPLISKTGERGVLGVLRSGCLSLGPKLEEFEYKFKKMVGTKYACAVSSGTAGLHLTMIAAGIGPGDEVITSPFSFIASSNAVLYVGAKPVFTDIDPVTYNMDPSKIEEKITPKTKAILVVHIFGQSAAMSPIIKIAKKHKLKIIEDACESILATYKGKNVGTFGESAVFAFYPNKQMTTGEGGMIVTNSKKIYKLCSSLRNQGRSSNIQWLDHKYLGYNYRMAEMNAALGISQLAILGSLIEKRRKVAKLYERYLQKFAGMVELPAVAKDNTHSWFVYVVRVKNPKIKRNNLIKLLAERGIATKPYLPSIHLFSFYKELTGHRKGDFPISEMISDTSLALPFYPGLGENDVKYICRNVVEVLNNYEKQIQK
ncbi:MAG: hypothetical protein A3H68_03215 [Candidatus Taylorbacteria bacterium RIFCSPLOWO2_02_FULL_46_40]|uniref:Polysaccharide biosynthesis protein n=1 Tax=Candidatus Taylorbacteria bacterium RIFCSPLOWO2_02_FULL_46_40 TaxID=1802329 RepID=A0A1G2P168_9BACT|nr:MAG: hypothetical protein A3H68_03215 [Candidatus Taylorbacteria bacterium RIFCSPLOWO2_02_FULL_46_40]